MKSQRPTPCAPKPIRSPLPPRALSSSRSHSPTAPAREYESRTNPAIFSDLLILKDLNSPGINTYKISKNPRILFTRNDFNSIKTNTSKTKDLKSLIINTSKGINIVDSSK